MNTRLALFLAMTGLSQPVVTLAAAEDVDTLRQALEEQQRQLEATSSELESLRQRIEQQENQSSVPVIAAAGIGPVWKGYAVINYRNYDFYKNVQDDDPDRRASTDVERLIIEPEFELGDGWSFEAEIEFEHGGTGAAVEYEADEFGEYEQEIEKGGEVIVEELFLQYKYRPTLNWRLGHIVVPVGMVNVYEKPGEYFTVSRSLAETAMLPNTWHETGAELFGFLGSFSYRLMVTTGLDSSGFSSQEWVAGGHQTQMEFVTADDLALTAQLDYHINPQLLVGGAFHIGDTTDNRHQQNLDVSALLTIWEAHLRYENGPWTLRSEILQGSLEHSEEITQANKNLVNASVRGISATPVAAGAEAFFVEAGYDVWPWFSDDTFDKRLDVFVRYDDYDTMAEVEGDMLDNPRYDRQAFTYGINYKPRFDITMKAEYSLQEHAGDIGAENKVFALGLGVEF